MATLIPSNTDPIATDLPKITFINEYNTYGITVYVNHEYYITYTTGTAYITIKSIVASINYKEQYILVRPSLVSEEFTTVYMNKIISAVPVDDNNMQINCDFVGIEISDLRVILQLHLKFLSGDYTVDLETNHLYDVAYVDGNTLTMKNIVGKLVTINFPYNMYPFTTEALTLLTQARNEVPNCILTFDCSDTFSTNIVKIDMRDIRSITEHIEVFAEPDTEGGTTEEENTGEEGGTTEEGSTESPDEGVDTV